MYSAIITPVGAHWNRPEFVCGSRRSNRKKTSLLQFHTRCGPKGAIFRTRKGYRDKRETHLIQEGGKRGTPSRCCRRGSGSCVECGEKIAAGRISPSVLLQIGLNSVLKFIRSHVILKHPDHGLPFAISDAVKRVGNVSGGLYWLANFSRSGETIAAHNIECSGRVRFDVPLRLPCVEQFRGDPTGKRFIEPDVIPPRRGYQIAKPLMRHLVFHSLGAAALSK